MTEWAPWPCGRAISTCKHCRVLPPDRDRREYPAVGAVDAEDGRGAERYGREKAAGMSCEAGRGAVTSVVVCD